MFRDSSASTKIQVSVYHNLSGLVVLNSAGGIESANSHFVNLLFGCGNDDLKVQSSPLTVTPSGHGKSVTVTRLSL